MVNCDFLVLRQFLGDYFSKKLHSIGVPVIPAFNYTDHFVTRLIRRLWLRWKLPFSHLWYNSELKAVGNRTLLFFDSQLTVSFVKWVRKHNPSSRIVFIYMNTVATSSVAPELLEKLCERWTFDRKDAQTYGLFYNPGGYPRDWTAEKEEKRYDVIFVGRDKGRLKQLMMLGEQFEKMGLNSYFHIVADNGWEAKKEKIYKPLIPYEEILKLVASSASVLDFIQDGQVGVDFRVYEALFSQTKIITNNQDISRYDFYRKDNIFILGKDKMEDLPAFLQSPYKPLNEDVIIYYEFSQWLSRINLAQPEKIVPDVHPNANIN